MSTPDPASRQRPQADPIVRSGGPAPDLTGITVAHRAMLADLGRLAGTAARLAAAPAALGREQAAGIRDYLEQLCDEIHQHHSREDEVLWPLVVSSAGTAVDLTPFSCDRTALGPVVDRVHAAARALPTDPARIIGELADGLAELRDLLQEYVTAEERDVFPIIGRYVSAADFHAAERQMTKGISFSHVRWLTSWIECFATPAEMRHMLSRAPLPFRVLLALSRHRYAALEQRAFGP